MSDRVFRFGEHLPGYAVPVLKERAVRAAAGILFLFAMVAYVNAWLIGNFQPTRVFVVAFLVDFTLRLLVNPRFAPSLILGQWIVRKQQPAYVGAAQKRFAWAIGFGLALLMLFLIVIRQVVGPVNLLVCAACLALLFCEAAFGICIGCRIYNAFKQEQARLCPGGVCETDPVPGAGGSLSQGLVVLAFAGFLAVWTSFVIDHDPYAPAGSASIAPTAARAPLDPAEAERCKVPEFARMLGHEQKWKLHNNCL